MRHLNADTTGSLVNADEIHDNGFYIGNHHFFVGGALEQVARVLRSVR